MMAFEGPLESSERSATAAPAINNGTRRIELTAMLFDFKVQEILFALRSF
jgi:hypothetical protein